MATVDQQQHLGQGSSWTPDSLPMGTDYMAWGQAAARHVLRDSTIVDSILKTAGYKQPKVIDVVGRLLATIQKDPTSKDPKVWHYSEKAGGAGLEAHLLGRPKVIIITTTPHRTKNWEMQTSGRTDVPAADEYVSLFAELPAYRFKMVMYDPGSVIQDPEGGAGTYNLNELAKASQADRRKLPPFGLRPNPWIFKGFSLTETAGQWAILYKTAAEGEKDARVDLLHQDGSESTEIYRFIQREPGKVHVAIRVVNVNPT